MSDQSNSFADELAREGLEYLQGLQSTLDEIEQDIMNLTAPPAEAAEALHRIARNAHSIKGTAGSYKYDLITAICHRLEDHVLALKLNSGNLETHIDRLLRYVDAIAGAVNAYLKNDNAVLEKLKRNFRVGETIGKPSASDQPPRQRVLVIEKIGALLMLVNNAIKDYNPTTLDIAVANNGYDGLGRLLCEHFDCVVMSNLSDLIRGVELMQILATVKNPNRATPFILLTSDQMLDLPKSAMKTYVVSKSGDLHREMLKTLTLILGLSPKARPEVQIAIRDVLLVDDSVPIQRLVQMVLTKSLNLKMQIASTGAEALLSLAEHRPDLAILDFQLPDTDGVALAEKIKSGYPGLPFIFLTGADSPEEQARLRAAGPQGIIRKPFPPMDLINLLKSYSPSLSKTG